MICIYVTFLLHSKICIYIQDLAIPMSLSAQFVKSIKINMRLLFFFVPMLLLQYYFMASLVMATVKNITSDQYALLVLKTTVVDHQGVLTNNWFISYLICSWVSTSCGTCHHRVTVLNNSIMGLQGTIPPHLGNLSFVHVYYFRL